MLWNCSATKKSGTPTADAPAQISTEAYVSAPHVILYKTKKNYFKNVPIILSEDKKVIVSYPDPSDLMLGDMFSYPTQLPEGYFLDNRGISKNVAFLKLTYEDYSRLLNPPSVDELWMIIIDYDPLVEMWDCGTGYNKKDIVSDLSALIRSGKLKENCIRVK